jgi:hypothetical protein
VDALTTTTLLFGAVHGTIASKAHMSTTNIAGPTSGRRTADTTIRSQRNTHATIHLYARPGRLFSGSQRRHAAHVASCSRAAACIVPHTSTYAPSGAAWYGPYEVAST